MLRSFFCLVVLSQVMTISVYGQQYIFDENQLEKDIDYSDLRYWAASPFKDDMADLTPGQDYQNKQDVAKADVFFVHPTTYTSRRNAIFWNADINDPGLIKKTDETTIKYQASVFNGSARVFAPRYRQAHLRVFYTNNEEVGKRALALAYQDVKSAFLYYLKHHNNGRPIIIAAHSQGTIHSIRLIQEFFEGKALNSQLVAAYLIGMPVYDDYFNVIKTCTSADDIGCFVSWRTMKKGFVPKYITKETRALQVTNPLNWSLDDAYVSKEQNLGSIFYDFDKLEQHQVDAQIHNRVLWVSKPKFKGSIFVQTRNYHIADYNFFYGNIRQNVENRLAKYLIYAEI